MKKTSLILLAALVLLASITGGVSASFVVGFVPDCDGVNVTVGQGTASQNAAGGSVTLYFWKNSVVVATSSAALTTVTGGYTATVAYPAGFDFSTPFMISARIYNSLGGVIGGAQPVSFSGVYCPPPPPSGDEGCTPGYWKNHLDSWQEYSPSSNFEAVFGVDASFSPTDFLTVVNLGGGGEKALGRHAVAALLNAASSRVASPYSVSQVISMVQNAYATGDIEGTKNAFEASNELGCPLN